VRHGLSKRGAAKNDPNNQIINKLSVFYFSMLTNWILHYARALGLFPFWLAWRETSDLLLLSTMAPGWSSCVTHYVIVQTLALCNHVWEATCVREHLILALSANKVICNKTFLLVASRLLVWLVAWSCRGPRILLILCLAFNIHWRLRSYPILCGSRTRLLWIASLFGHHLTV